jgi:hypothetical protein
LAQWQDRSEKLREIGGGKWLASKERLMNGAFK